MTFATRLLLLTLLFSALAAGRARAVEVLIVGDTRLKPVAEIVSGIGSTLRGPVKTFSPGQLHGTLESVARQEQARVVIALGKEAIAEALRLPTHILVIYDLVVTPPAISRPNTTGFYMATPAREYADFVARYLRGLGRIAVLGSREQISILARGDSSRLATYGVKNSFELVNTLQQLSDADAILLLPDVSVLTATALEEAFLLSFRRKIPLLGVSEKNVKDGALFALVVDPVFVGRNIGEYANRALAGGNVGQLPPSPPRKFQLFVNLDTARKMGIPLSEELLRTARRTFP